MEKLETYLVVFRDTQTRQVKSLPVEAKDEKDAIPAFRKRWGYDYQAIVKVEKW